jgi:two-component system cell cycle response regulator CpdR
MKTLSILYAEDNKDLRDTLSDMLECPGRTVVAVATGEDALAAWQTGAFDLLVTDISLPGMSGTELARILLAKNPAQWVVLCSGYQYGSHVAKLGPNVRALPKPFELEELDALMDEICAALSPP